MQKPAQRIQNLPNQLFAGLVKTAMTLQAAGHDVINLGQGNPDLPTPPHVVSALVAAAQDPANHRYCPFSGIPELKEAIAHWYQRRFAVELNPDREVCILIGSKIGLQEISLCYLEPGDLCLMPDPCYPDYWSGIALAGADMYRMPLLAANGFLPDLAAIPTAVAERAKLMFLNFPCNPTGAAIVPEALADVIAYCQKHDIWLVYDAAYCDLVYDGRRPFSLLQCPGGRGAGIEIQTLSKSFNMAGWRIAFAAGNAEVIGALNLIQDHLNCSQFPAVQRAAAAALLGPEDSVHALRATYEERRNAFVEACHEVGWPVPPPAGSFFVWCPTPPGYTAAQFSDLLLEKTHIVTAPGTGFGHAGEGYVRVSLCTDAQRLREAAGRIGALGIFRR